MSDLRSHLADAGVFLVGLQYRSNKIKHSTASRAHLVASYSSIISYAMV